MSLAIDGGVIEDSMISRLKKGSGLWSTRKGSRTISIQQDVLGYFQHRNRRRRLLTLHLSEKLPILAQMHSGIFRQNTGPRSR